MLQNVKNHYLVFCYNPVHLGEYSETSKLASFFKDLFSFTIISYISGQNKPF